MEVLDLCYEKESEIFNKLILDIWNRQPHIKINKMYSLYGWSIAACNTSFILKELSIMFDIGVIPASYCTDVFITHGHSDHIYNILNLKYKKNKNVNIYVPIEILNNVNNIFKNKFELSHSGVYDEKISKNNIIGVYSGFQKDIKINKSNFKLTTFKCFHSIPCIGYGLSIYKTKLKQEYINCDRNELNNLKKQNIKISEVVLDNIFVYLGDTTHEVFYYDENNELFKYKYIMIECTFLSENDIENAKNTKHMHWNDLKIIVKNNPNIIFIIYHFSQRYNSRLIKEFFEIENIKNVIPWISS